MKKRLFLFILFYLSFNMCIHAGILDSGHNMLRQSSDNGTSSEEGKAGVCSFCHIPHSASGSSMNIGDASEYEPNVGEVGRICGKCHDKDKGYAGAPRMSSSIYDAYTAHNNHPLVDDNSDIYGRSFDTASNDISKNKIGGTVQWMSKWPATQPDHKSASDPTGKTTIECSSCHNVHQVTKGMQEIFKDLVVKNPSMSLLGIGASGEFLRANAYDTTGELNNTINYNEITGEGKKQIFCEYCHIGRATSAYGLYNSTVTVDGKRYSTHPVGRGDVTLDSNFKPVYTSVNDSTIRKIFDNDKNGWDSSVVVPLVLNRNHKIHIADDNSKSGGHLGGSYGIGYDTLDVYGEANNRKGIIICQTCHKVHSIDRAGAGQTHNGEFIDYNDDIYGMFDSTKPDLLVINNNSRNGFNELCEACHSYRPFLRIKAINKGNGDKDKYKGHPLKHSKYENGSYKFNVSDNVTDSWKSADSSLCDPGDPIVIPDNWPTGGENQPVCLSCHDVHGGMPGTKLLRQSISGNKMICDDCHKLALNKLGLSHPVGDNVTLINTDGATWPDQANLTLFGPVLFGPDYKPRLTSRMPLFDGLGVFNNKKSDNYQDFKDNNNVTIGCDTCHDWANGMIHYYAGRRRDVVAEMGGSHAHVITKETQSLNNDPNHNSELCVSCHTAVDAVKPNESFGTKGVNFDYLIDASGGSLRGIGVGPYLREGDSTNITLKGANPSPWIIEYPKKYNNTEVSRLSRLGTHPSGLRIENNIVSDSRANHYSFIYHFSWGDTSDCTTKIGKRNFITGVKNKKRSKWGQKFDTLLTDKDKNDFKGSAVIVCQSCHTPHWASEGLVEYNSAAYGSEPTPNSALLLATQAESFMCRNCHFPNTHPVSRPSEQLKSRWEIKDEDFYDSIDYVSRTNTTIVLTSNQERALPKRNRVKGLLRDSTDTPDAYGRKWNVSLSQGPMPPANYPKKGGSMGFSDISALPGNSIDISTSRIVCDSCHAPHAANTSMGTFMLEAIDDSTAGKSSNYWATGALYQGAAEPTNLDDAPTCYLCHNK